jgi:hypothetical protein
MRWQPESALVYLKKKSALFWLALWIPCLSLITVLSACDPIDISVTTQGYDNARTGLNRSETILNTSNVNPAAFGKLFTRAVDDHIYAQPLYVPKVTIPNAGVRNVLYVATVNNSVYAFDADDPGAATPLWRVNLNGGTPGARPINTREVGQHCEPYRDFQGSIGIVGTPVIDAPRQALYVVVRTKEAGEFVQRLHALDIATGAARSNSPIVIKASVQGTGAGSSNGVLTFDPGVHNQRGALLLANGIVYITWASYCGMWPYHGWIMGYDEETLVQKLAKVVTPNGDSGGIWQSQAGPSADASGNVYLTVGDGTATAPKGGQDYGNAFLKLSPSGEVLDWFIPFNFEDLAAADLDVGSAGVLLIPETKLLISGGKEGKLYLLNRNHLGHFQPGRDSQIVQSFMIAPRPTGMTEDVVLGDQARPGGLAGTPAYWNGPGGPYVYTWGNLDRGKAFRLRNGLLMTTPVSQTTALAIGWPGGILSISANGAMAGTGILWALLGLDGAGAAVVHGTLHAFDAADLSRELWNSKQNAARDDFGNLAKFNTPVVANGKVYIATFSNQVAVYGLLPEGDGLPIVNAGPEQRITLPNTATLAGTATDDGLPLSPGVLTTTWVQISGPSQVTFATPHNLTTKVTFSAPGTYVLRLTASDGALAVDSDVTVEVLAPE